MDPEEPMVVDDDEDNTNKSTTANVDNSTIGTQQNLAVPVSETDSESAEKLKLELEEAVLLAEDPFDSGQIVADASASVTNNTEEDEDVLLLDDDIKSSPRPSAQDNSSNVQSLSAEITEIESEVNVEVSPEGMEMDQQKEEIKKDDNEAIEKPCLSNLSADASSFVIPLVSPKIPSLAYKTGLPAGKVLDKEVKPTMTPPQKLKVESPFTDSVSNLLTYTKSISSALAKPAQTPEQDALALTGEKRKYSVFCANVNCNNSNLKSADDLITAKKAALIYFHFNTGIKKVYKICVPCNTMAETFIQKALNSVKDDDMKSCVFDTKTEPQGQDGDVIEVKDGEEDDDPSDVLVVENEDKEIIQLTTSFDKIIGDILSTIDMKSQIDKCEKKCMAESWSLDTDFRSLDSKLNFVEKQVVEAKKMYDQVTGYNQPVPVVLEQLDIDCFGRVLKTKGDNPHLDKVAKHFKIKTNTTNSTQSHQKQPLQKKHQDAATSDAPTRKHNVTSEEIEEVLESGTKRGPDQRIVLTPTPKTIPRVIPMVGNIVYALSRTLLHFWLKGQVSEVLNMGNGKSPEFVIRFEPTRRGQPVRDGKSEGATRLTKQVTAKQIAYNIPCPFVLPVGSRIIAKFRDELKTEPVGDGQFYAGVVAEPPKNTNNFRYLVFFDDGYAQYVSHRDVLMVYEASKEVWADVHADSSDFIRNYVQKYPERPMVRMSVGQIVTTEWNGKWWVARVIELDSSLVKMKFENDGRCEWIYRGSTRLSPLFEKQTRQKTRSTARRQITHSTRGRNQPTIEYNYGDENLNDRKPNSKPVARKSTGVSQVLGKDVQDVQRLSRLDYGEFEGTIIKRPIPENSYKPREFVQHNCNSSCVYPYNEGDKEFKKLSPLAVPLYLGWSRDIAKNPRRTIFYRAPCGRRLRDLDELYDFLTLTSCDIPIDHFCFDLAVDCLNEFRHARQHSFLPDLTYGKEQTPVQVVNAFDFEYPPYVEYSSFRIPGQGVHLNTNDEFLVSCDCEDDCRDKSKCSCWQLTFSGISFTKLNNPDFPYVGYENRRLKDHIVSGVYECNSRCKCSKTCCNRVVQNGLKVPLQVFKTAAKGWGIRPLFDIPEGAFICIYAGQVLTEQGANEDGKQFGDEYLAELDYIEVNEQIKEDYESDVTDIEAEDEDKPKKKRGKGKGRENGDSGDEFDSHATDSSYRGPKPSAERTVSTRGKNGKSRTGSKFSNSSDNENDDDEEGRRMRSSFNPDAMALAKPQSKQAKEERLPLREYFGGENELCYIMDAKTTGNIGRYLNHSCQPNVFVQNVFVDTHDLRFPWVSFFASKHIRAGSELTWDYNYDIGSVPNKVMYCYCGSPECRGRLL